MRATIAFIIFIVIVVPIGIVIYKELIKYLKGK